MYPIALWSYDQLVGRLDNLMHHGFYRETILACNQTTIQLFIRLLQVHIAKSSMLPSNGIRGGRLINIISLEERDQLLASIQSPTDIKRTWDSFSRYFGLYNTQTLFDKSFEEGAWSCYSTKRKIITNFSIELPYGIHYASAKIQSNGYLNANENDLKVLASYALELARNLLHPDHGVFSMLNLDISEKMPALKLRHSNLDAYYP